jgi:hypothetical protein
LIGPSSIVKDEQETLDPSALGTDAHAEGSAATLDADRTFLLECRLDHLHSALQSARAEADVSRDRLAESVVREAEHARRALAIHEDLVSARQELASVHRRLEQSDALRAEAEGLLLESGARDEAAELARLRREVREERQRFVVQERTLTELRGRVEELTATREALLTRIAEWQSLVRGGDSEAADLSDFIAGLRGEILDLEHRNAMGERREAELREQLERAGAAGAAHPRPRGAGEDLAREGAVVPSADMEREDAVGPVEELARDAAEAQQEEAEPAAAAPLEADGTEGTEGLVRALGEAGSPDGQIDLLLRLGRSRDERAFHAIRRWAIAPEPRLRAAAFEALGRLFEDDPSRLEPHLRWGLADPDPRVRRRVILAAAAARGLALRPLLEPLRADPDPQVRRVTHEVLRRASAAEPATQEAVVLVASASGGVA